MSSQKGRLNYHADFQYGVRARLGIARTPFQCRSFHLKSDRLPSSIRAMVAAIVNVPFRSARLLYILIFSIANKFLIAEIIELIAWYF